MKDNGGISNWLRVLRPLSWWIILVLVLYGIRMHQRLMRETRLEFSVTLDGKVADFAETRLDGQPVASGKNISLGEHTFTVSHPKGEPFQTQFFAWYGAHSLGTIDLRRSMGGLRIQAVPAAAKITVTGPEFSTTLYVCSGTNLTVPTDAYAVRADYAHWSESQDVAVAAGQTAASVFSPHLGSLHLTCNKDGATFNLQFSNGQTLDGGSFPATATDLPAGRYQLTAWYHAHQIQKSVLVEAGATNEAPVEFVYGAARIESTPPGASVNNGDGNFAGQTPLDVPDLTPQTAHFNLSMPGYEPLSIALEIAAGRTNLCRTNLVNSRYLSDVRQANSYLAAGDYGNALQAASDALAVSPNDAVALALQSEANEHLSAERERREELERPRKVFDLICEKNPDTSLFAGHELTTSKAAKAVAAALVESLNSAPPFEIQYSGSLETNTFGVTAKQESSLGILGGSERVCLIVVGQAKADETQIYFKVLEYQIRYPADIGALVNPRQNRELIPVSPQRVQMTDTLSAQVRNGEQTVTDRIQQAISSAQ